MRVVKVFTDGGYRRKSKLGSHSYVILKNEVVLKEYYLAIPEAKDIKVTNNTMEMDAVIKAFNWLISDGGDAKDESIYLWTDSQYVQLGLTKWIHTWKENGWRSSSGKPVKNKELWVKLDELYNILKKKYASISIQWVEGHVGNHWNERADELCNKAMDEYVINVDYQKI